VAIVTVLTIKPPSKSPSSAPTRRSIRREVFWQRPDGRICEILLAAAAKKKKQMTSGHRKAVAILFIFFSPLTSYSSIKVAQIQVSTRTVLAPFIKRQDVGACFSPAQPDRSFKMVVTCISVEDAPTLRLSFYAVNPRPARFYRRRLLRFRLSLDEHPI
jgi:hypothetical protein